jgi:hypothetical protein
VPREISSLLLTFAKYRESECVSGISYGPFRATYFDVMCRPSSPPNGGLDAAIREAAQ